MHKRNQYKKQFASSVGKYIWLTQFAAQVNVLYLRCFKGV